MLRFVLLGSLLVAAKSAPAVPNTSLDLQGSSASRMLFQFGVHWLVIVGLDLE